MKSEVIQLTPEKARQLLALNTCNRPLNRNHADELARRMKAGQWKLNGEPVIIGSETGEPAPDDLLLNGQHRCEAVVRSGVSVSVLLVSGLPKSIFDTLDMGKPRTHADVLAIGGENYASRKASAIKLVDRYLNHDMKTVRHSAADVMRLVTEHPDLHKSIAFCKSGRGLLPDSVLMASHYLFSIVDEEGANTFVDKLMSGIDLQEGSGILLLRQRLVQNAASSAKVRMSPDYIFGLMIKAWNAYRKNKKVRTLRFQLGGDKAEAFPEII